MITYSNGALREIDLMTEKYSFKNREETLNFALFVIKRLQEKGAVELKDYENRD